MDSKRIIVQQAGKMNPYAYLRDSANRPDRLSQLAILLARLFPSLLIIHVAVQIANGLLVPWDVDEGKIPLNSPVRVWEPFGILSIFVFFNLLILSVIFVYVKRTGVSIDASAAELRTGGIGRVVAGFWTMLIAILVAAIVALISWLVFGSTSAIILIPTGLAAMGWVLVLLGIAQVITGRDLLAEDKLARTKRNG